MATVARLLATIASLVVAATAAAAAQSLKPEWSRPVGGKTRFVGVEEYGRCSVFVDNGVVQVVNPTGDIAWSWPFARISKYINPQSVAISSACDVVAFVGNASYKYVWIVDRAGTSASIKFVATPADVEFDRSGKYVAVGTYGGSMFFYSVNGELQWQRDTQVSIVNDIEFTDDGQRIVFTGWGGAGVVSRAGQVEWSQLSNRLAASQDLGTLIFSHEPNHGPGLPRIHVTDGNRVGLWHRWASIDAFVSASGHRILANVDAKQDKEEKDFFGEPQAGDVELLARDGAVVRSFPNYSRPIALSEHGTRMWLGAEDQVHCVNDRGDVFAMIDARWPFRNVRVSRDFAQVLVVSEKDLHPVSVERYAIPAPCKP